jgi:flagellar hook protein FlgE
MTDALSSGVTGLQAHQMMLDATGNNLANVNTTAFKASRVTFAELLGQTFEQGSQPTERIGGTNPQQVGGGVTVAGITPDMTQGNIVNTGNPFDVALEGEGYFVVNDGARNLYTRAGAFGVDENGRLVDPNTGYRVQRIGLAGESDGFQISGDSSIRIPYDVALPGNTTSVITFSGNLSSDAAAVPRAQVMTSSLAYTYDGNTEAALTTEIDQLDQFSGGSGTDGQLGSGETGLLTISGYHRDGTAFSSGLTFTVTETTTVGALIDHLNDNVLSGATASLVGGRIQIKDAETGTSRSDIRLAYSGTGTLTTPPYFEITTVGGDEVRNVNTAIYDSQGGKHVLSAAFVRTDAANTWDFVLTSVTGNVREIDLDERRISGITFGGSVYEIDPEDRRVDGLAFNPQSGAFAGIPDTELAQFIVTFNHDITHPQTITMDFGTVGSFAGLTQFAGNSTAVAREQDGYQPGSLSAVSVNNEGVLVGSFTNGVKKDLATLQIALFKNPAGLEGVGGGYFTSSPNSGGAVATQAMSAGAGSVHGGALEKSNADVATEFVNLIQAQNGFQANARTIRVANDILRELTNLIR